MAILAICGYVYLGKKALGGSLSFSLSLSLSPVRWWQWPTWKWRRGRSPGCTGRCTGRPGSGRSRELAGLPDGMVLPNNNLTWMSPACPTSQVSLRKSMVPQMLRRHLIKTPSIHPNLMTFPLLAGPPASTSSSPSSSFFSAFCPAISSSRVGRATSALIRSPSFWKFGWGVRKYIIVQSGTKCIPPAQGSSR